MIQFAKQMWKFVNQTIDITGTPSYYALDGIVVVVVGSWANSTWDQ